MLPGPCSPVAAVADGALKTILLLAFVSAGMAGCSMTMPSFGGAAHKNPVCHRPAAGLRPDPFRQTGDRRQEKPRLFERSRRQPANRLAPLQK